MTETPALADDASLSALLREVSFAGHGGRDTGAGDDGAEEPRYATAFLRGGLNRAGIAAQFAQHYLMYEALEAATDAQIARHGKDFPFAMPELRRLPELTADLEYWIGHKWETQVRGRYATPAIVAYADRIREVAPASLPHFVAHHYTRYLADLSGGFMIAKMFRDSYGSEAEHGMRFYRFERIADPNEYKNRYRSLLDNLDFDSSEKKTCAEEVALGYRYNNRAGADLETDVAEYLA